MGLIAYASRTGCKRNLAVLRAHDWRLLVVAGARLRNEGFPYALDNGAWGSFVKGLPFNTAAFKTALYKMGTHADWVVAPDIVAGGTASLKLSLAWLPEILDVAPRALLAVQDGMLPTDVGPFLGERVGIFVGGTTDWKLKTLAQWGALAAARRCWCHVGRVNSAKRIRLCLAAGITSFDGTSASRFSVTVPALDATRRESVGTRLPLPLKKSDDEQHPDCRFFTIGNNLLHRDCSGDGWYRCHECSHYLSEGSET